MMRRTIAQRGAERHGEQEIKCDAGGKDRQDDEVLELPERMAGLEDPSAQDADSDRQQHPASTGSGISLFP
jgi:hypothetical protein